MAQLVAIIGASHAPMMLAAPDSAPPQQRSSFFEGWAALRAQIVALQPDVAVIVSNEHFTNFFLDNFPQLCVGVGATHTGPAESWLGVPQGPMTGHEALAQHLLHYSIDHGYEPSFSHRLRLDHGICTVHRLLDPSGQLPIVPIIQNCAVAPMATLRRCYDFGAVLGDAIRSWPSDERVVLIGAGGLSHSVGNPFVGQIDEQFDRWFLAALERGDIESILDVSDDELELAGNGTHEIRSWLTAAGATRVHGANDPSPMHTLVYEPIAPWITGMGLGLFT
jgi:Catalytic LigB subunit of aromatic ring-opening dioxygenase